MSGQRSTKYLVFNHTDGFPAASFLFDTKDQAKQWISSWRTSISEIQGYYLTSTHERISPHDVAMRIQEVDADHEVPESDRGPLNLDWS